MILRDLYSIRPSSFSNRCALAAKYSQNLKQWRAELSQFLDDGINMALLIPIFQRQRNVLNLAYWHAMILTHRPFLLSNFARLQRNGKSRRRSVPHKDQAGDSVQACLDAAMHVVDTVNDLIQAGQLFRAFWVRHLIYIVLQTPANTGPVHILLRVLRRRRSLCLHNTAADGARRDVAVLLRRRDTLPDTARHARGQRVPAGRAVLPSVGRAPDGSS